MLTPFNVLTFFAKDADLKTDGGPFATELPAGKYLIKGWGAELGVVRVYSKLLVGVPFTVKTGATIYMGNFHFMGYSSNMRAFIRDEAARDIPVLHKRFPVLASVPTRTTIAPRTRLQMIGGYGQTVEDSAQIYVPLVP